VGHGKNNSQNIRLLTELVFTLKEDVVECVHDITETVFVLL
jgi:hypothetical protein